VVIAVVGGRLGKVGCWEGVLEEEGREEVQWRRVLAVGEWENSIYKSSEGGLLGIFVHG